MGQSMREPTVSFECPECGAVVHEFIELPVHDLSAEVHSHGDGFSTEHVDCAQCNMGFEIELVATISGLDASLLGWANVEVMIDTPEEADYGSEYERYLAARDPNDPFDMYKRAMTSLEEVRERGAPDTQAFQRMIFVHLISIMEAYLGDKLVRLTMADKQVMMNVVASQEALKSKRIALPALLSDPESPKQHVQQHIQHMLFHDVVKVEKVYMAALGKSIYSSQDDKKLIAEAVLRRHDCVHRNGRTKDGKEHVDIDQEFNKRVILAIKRLINNIENNA